MQGLLKKKWQLYISIHLGKLDRDILHTYSQCRKPVNLDLRNKTRENRHKKKDY